MSRINNLVTSKRPIGFWIKSADQALDRMGDAIHESDGFTRRRWQVLSLIVRSEPVSIDALVEQFRPMLGVGEVQAELSVLEDRKIIHYHAGGVSTTTTGADIHRHLEARQITVREKAMQGIDEADYLATLRCLSRIVENLSED